MKSFLLIILSCRVLSYALPIHPKTEIVTEEMELAEKYPNSSYPQQASRTYLRSEDNNISTGIIGQKMKFCGVETPDELHSNTPAEMRSPRGGVPNIGAFSHFPGSPKWNRSHLTYRFQNYTPDMTSIAIKEAVAKAFDIWSSASPLNFISVDKDGDIVMTFYPLEHKTPFTGPVIAYAYGPGERLGGDVFLNEMVNWTMDNNKTFTNTGTNLLIAVLHELGHVFGLGHSTVEGSVMKDEYVPLSYIYGNPSDCRTIQLHPDDIAGIQSLYGP